jgi:tetratricopeptide (TPR) repeat protein
MADEIQFRFSIKRLPDGVALTGSEIEQKLLEALDAKECPDTLWSLAVFYQRTGHLEHASGCVRRAIELSDDPERIGAGFLGLGQLEESRGDYAAAAKRYGEALALEPCSQHTWRTPLSKWIFPISGIASMLARRLSSLSGVSNRFRRSLGETSRETKAEMVAVLEAPPTN